MRALILHALISCVSPFRPYRPSLGLNHFSGPNFTGLESPFFSRFSALSASKDDYSLFESVQRKERQLQPFRDEHREANDDLQMILGYADAKVREGGGICVLVGE